MAQVLNFMNINIFNPQFIAVLLMSAVVGAAAAYIGSLMLSKRMALVGGAFGHLALPGIALALIYGFDVSLGALIFLVLGMILIWYFEKKSHLSMEVLSAVVFTSSLAIAWLFLPEDKKAPALIGDISQVNFWVLLISILAAVVVIVLTKYIYKKMILVNISQDLAKVSGVNLKRYNFLFLLAIVVAVALGVRIIGGLMTVALIAIPAASARNISQNLKQYQYLSIIFGGLACIIGVLNTIIISLPAGPLIIIVSSIIFILSLFFKTKR